MLQLALEEERPWRKVAQGGGPYWGGSGWPPPPGDPAGPGGQGGWSVRPDWTRHFRGPARTEYLLFGAGGALLALSPLLPWLNVAFLGSMNLFRLTTAANSVVVLPWAMVGVGVALVIATVSGARLTGLAIASRMTVVVALVAGGGDLIALVRAVHDSSGLASLGVGLYGGVAALGVLAIGAIRVNQARSRAAAGPSPWARPPQRPTVPVPPDPRPGWKPDPWGLPGRQRYWDRQSWSHESH